MEPCPCANIKETSLTYSSAAHGRDTIRRLACALSLTTHLRLGVKTLPVDNRLLRMSSADSVSSEALSMPMQITAAFKCSKSSVSSRGSLASPQTSCAIIGLYILVHIRRIMASVALVIAMAPVPNSL